MNGRIDGAAGQYAVYAGRRLSAMNCWRCPALERQQRVQKETSAIEVDLIGVAEGLSVASGRSENLIIRLKLAKAD